MARIKEYWRWISLFLLLAFTLLVFSFSFDSASESTEKSTFITDALQSVCDTLKIDVEIIENGVRKTAHIVEFAVLGALALMCSRAFRFGVCPALLYSIIAATIDESIQICSPERSSSTLDVLLDFGGALFGVLCLLLIIRLYKLRKSKKEKAIELSA